MLIPRFWTAVLLAGCAACSVTAPAAKTSNEDLDVRGTMDASMLEALRKQQWGHVRTIRFSSMGGLPDLSVDIARLLARSGKPITVHEVCGSACLDVLVIRRVKMEPGTLVLLHNTPTGQALTTRDYPEISAFLAGLGNREDQWLAENGVDPRLTLFAEAATAPICVFAPEDSPAAASRLLTMRRFDAWAPRNATLAALGITAAHTWRQNAASVLHTMRVSYPKADLTRLRPADEPAIPDADTMRRVLMRVRVCKREGVPAIPTVPTVQTQSAG